MSVALAAAANPNSAHITLLQVAGSLALVAIAIAVSFWRSAEVEQDMAVAVVRSFVQLTAAGAATHFPVDAI